ncbi:MAG: septal ring lytic transglycosylase RlpA family protein, partial [Rickettsiales bacterium]|nr:septal ring lytic transglycosylase RlpA family protein [Rickettsiales bacterium]
PRMQPDYVEVGLASWYGPGFHGGKTANGERFDSSELTAAHRTLPLPSIVRVTMVSTGKQVIVRVNDRGPFAHSRILDISRGAAEKIGLLRAGVAKVRVEYMKAESEKFADLLADGRDPKSIDLEREVLNAQSEPEPARYAQASQTAPTAPVAAAQSTWDSIVAPDEPIVQDNNPVIVADDEVGVVSNEPAPVPQVVETELQAPTSASSVERTEKAGASPFAALDLASPPKPSASEAAKSADFRAPITQENAPVVATSPQVYVQIGAFQNEANAERLRSKYAGVSGLRVEQKANASGQTLFHVRMGPFSSSQESNKAFKQLQDAGAEVKIVKT